MHLNETSKYTLAKSFTELAIQNGLINQHADSADTAKEVTTFFKTIIDTIDKNDSDNQ